MEIERKFLLDALPEDLDGHPSELIEQGYLAIHDDGVEVRVRRRGDRALLTVKSGGSGARVEEEIEIDQRRFDSLWPLTDGRRVRKRRFYVPLSDGLTAELDVYEDALAGLATAEVEFASADASSAFVAPSWLGTEVTDDSRYKNQALALRGRPS